MVNFRSKDRYDANDLREIVEILRGEDGCPWDRVQTHETIRRDLLEEAAELCEAIDRADPGMMLEELGDVWLQVIFHASLEQEAGHFTLDDVAVMDGVWLGLGEVLGEYTRKNLKRLRA